VRRLRAERRNFPAVADADFHARGQSGVDDIENHAVLGFGQSTRDVEILPAAGDFDRPDGLGITVKIPRPARLR